MKRMLFIGEGRSGKSTLIRRLSGDTYVPRRALAVEYHGPYVNTPGEFLENRRFYPALITASMDCSVLVFVQDATRRVSLFPPQFAALFNRRVLGVITKADCPEASIERAKRFLKNAGARDILVIIPEREEEIRQLALSLT